jgi:hypothetical protein
MSDSPKLQQPATPPSPAEMIELAAANLVFTRSADYKTIYSSVVRTRIGNGDVSIVFSKTTHAPSAAFNANIIEEQVEVVMSWVQAKMFKEVLVSLLQAVDEEIGEIPIPSAFKIDKAVQRAAVQGLGLGFSAPAPPPSKSKPKTEK